MDCHGSIVRSAHCRYPIAPLFIIALCNEVLNGPSFNRWLNEFHFLLCFPEKMDGQE
jgi:hypothetical protein